MASLQICTTALGPGLPSLATLLFNRQVQGIMPVLDHKPIRQDHDDDHYGKLMDMQHKNDNNTPQVFSYIPIGSAVAVQQEDGRPWTHGIVLNRGDHNHHGRSYTIQLTTNGRCITQNRQHIKPTAVTADAYIKHQSYKQCNISTDLLADICNNIDKNPGAYNNKQVLNSVVEEEQSIGQIVNNPNQQVAENIEHSIKRTGINKKEGTEELRGNILTIHEG